jgi:hypothetical protein
MILSEKINKNLRKKLKRLNQNIDFHLELFGYNNNKVYAPD